MTSRPPPKNPFRRYRSLRDGLVATLVILVCFASSAFWVYDQARKRELSHHREAIENAARRAALSFNKKLLAAGATNSADRARALARLRELEAQESLVSRMAIIEPTEKGHLVIVDTDLPEDAQASSGKSRPANDEEAKNAEIVLKDPKDLALVRPDGTVKVFVPIQDQGRTVGVATAESAIHTLEAGLASIRFATWSSVTVGGLLAVLVGLWVFLSRRKSYLAAERLARAESADRLIVDALGEIFYEHHIADDTITWRGATMRILGTHPADLAPGSLDWQERIHPADREAYREARHRLVSGQLFSVEYRVARDDGRFIWLLDRGGMLPAEGDDDAPPVAIGVLLDVSESREAQQRLRDVADAAGEYIWEVDEGGRYIYVSDRVRDVLGYEPEAMLGERPIEYVPLEQREYVLETSNALSEHRCAFRDFEHQITRADGTVIWISVNGVPSFDANGNWSGFRGAGLDITARKEAAEALIREKEAANAAVEAKGQFLAMMSHEIRTPLNSVLGFADLLAESSLQPSQREHVEIIRNSGDALLVLLNDILDFSRLESAGLAVDIGNVNLRDCLQQVIDLYRPGVEQKKISLTLEIDPHAPAAIQTDRARLRQILLNLVGNAVKFTEAGSVHVRVTSRSAQPPALHGTVRIEVVDTGIGIPAEKQALLFQPFSQVDSSATRRFGGTGLGLAICKRLAELLGGVVGLKESTKKGSCFYLNLPDLPPASAESKPVSDKPRAPLVPVAPGSFKVVRVLVVEDNRINRLLAQKMLSSLGVESHSAENGLECVERHKQLPYDIILMDVQMPVLDGLEATRLIREHDRSRPGVAPVIVALTADAMLGDRERCLAAGMDDYLSKPIRLDALAALIERYGLYSRE